MSVNTVKGKILTKLNTISSLKAVFDYEATNSDGKYPFATLTLRGGRADFLSTQHNVRTRRFRIRVYQERSAAGQGSQSAEQISTDVLDEIEIAFDADTTLGGTVKFVRPVQWTANYINRELDTRILEIDLDAVEVVSSS